jgi:hypothetical protein
VIPFILDFVHGVFVSQCRVPKSCFALILAQAAFLVLGHRYEFLADDDPAVTLMCELFDVFSTGDPGMTAPMTDLHVIAVSLHALESTHGRVHVF